MLTRDGRLIDPTGAEHQPAWHSPFEALSGIAADGNRLVAKLQKRAGLLNISKLDQVEATHGPWEKALLSPQIWYPESRYGPRNRFHKISVDREARICLHKGRETLRLDFTRNDPVFRSESTDPVVPANARNFKPLRGANRTRIKMSLAEWKDGSQAWLDVRGLLHLRSSDRSVPELTITLSQQEPAFWSSDGKVCGPNYFIGDATAEPAYFRNVVNGFVARVR